MACFALGVHLSGAGLRIRIGLQAPTVKGKIQSTTLPPFTGFYGLMHLSHGFHPAEVFFHSFFSHVDRVAGFPDRAAIDGAFAGWRGSRPHDGPGQSANGNVWKLGSSYYNGAATPAGHFTF